MKICTNMFFVLLTLFTLDATRGSNLRGKEQGRKLEAGQMLDSEDLKEQAAANDVPIPLDNDCQGRPLEITFQYNGGDCSQSDTDYFKIRQKCTDTGIGPPAAGSGAQSYITATATSRGGSDIYFSGPVNVGEKFTLNEQRTFDKLSIDLVITIFETLGGTLLQTMVVSLYCSQPWSLFDKFGASQVTQWVDTSGRTDEDWVRHDTNAPTDNATNAPTNAPTDAQTNAPTNTPTNAPTTAPTTATPTNEQRCRAFDNQECDDNHVIAFCSTGGELGCCPKGTMTHWDVDDGAEPCSLVWEATPLSSPEWEKDRCRAFDNQECIDNFPNSAICSSGGEQGCCPDGITLHWEWEEGAEECTTDDRTFNYWDMDGRGCEWIRGKIDHPDYQDEDIYSRSKCLDANNSKGGLCPSCEFNDVSNACPTVCA